MKKMHKAKVIIRRASYEYGTLKPRIEEIADAFLAGRVRPGCRVVVKPNFVAPARPERAMVTHPLLIKAIAEYVLHHGGRVQISDSPIGSFDKILQESGVREALRGLDVTYREFTASVPVDVGEPFKKIEIARDALEADLLINLPKLKTHAQMRMTLGVKNLFGCVVGLRKPEWHLRTGVNRELFALLLVRIHEAVRPALTILDGILAMEGEGPGRGGTPRDLGIVAGSDDAYALDVTLCRMLGLDPLSVFTNRAALEIGLAPDDVAVDGEVPAVPDFCVPEIVPLVFGPEKIHGFMRRHLVQRPLADDSLCQVCGECWKYCPVRAIAHDERRIRIDYGRCIRCYCCIEVCPHGALRHKEPLLGQVVRKLSAR